MGENLTSESVQIQSSLSQAYSPLTSSPTHCHTFTSKEEVYFYANVVVLLAFIVLGLIGNCLVISVHCIDSSKNSSTILLLALAILDNILLLNGVFASVLHSAFPYTGSGHWFWDNKDYFMVVTSPVAHWALTCSTWCIVLVTIDRYIVVSRPLKATKLCTVRRARYSLLIMISLATVYNIPRAFEYRMTKKVEECTNETVWRKEKTALSESSVYQLCYTVILYFIVNYIVPLAVLLVLNGLLVNHMRNAKAYRRNLTVRKLLHHSNSLKLALLEESFTRLVLCIIIRFILCATPGLALRILILLNDPVLGTYQIFSNLLMYINSGTNFIIFAVMGRRFQKVMMTSLCKTKTRQRKALRISSMASLELIRSFSSLAIQTTSTSTVGASSQISEGDNTQNDRTREGYSQLEQLNNIIDTQLTMGCPVRKFKNNHSSTPVSDLCVCSEQKACTTHSILPAQGSS